MERDLKNLKPEALRELADAKDALFKAQKSLVGSEEYRRLRRAISVEEQKINNILGNKDNYEVG